MGSFLLLKFFFLKIIYLFIWERVCVCACTQWGTAEERENLKQTALYLTTLESCMTWAGTKSQTLNWLCHLGGILTSEILNRSVKSCCHDSKKLFANTKQQARVRKAIGLPTTEHMASLTLQDKRTHRTQISQVSYPRSSVFNDPPGFYQTS